MPERQPITNPELEMQNAADILNAMQTCDRFQMDFADKKGSRIVLLSGPEYERKRYYPTEDFLRAVDYYYKNRGSEISVSLAMQSPDGVVNVWSPHDGSSVERKVVVSLRNTIVPQILEFAYLIVRDKQKKESSGK